MKTAIIGGGAAGLALACMLCMRGERPVIFEKQLRVGRKLLSTGNGRCNFTNLNASVKDYHGDLDVIKNVLNGFTPWNAMDFFAEIGVESEADEEGRVYPTSNQAAGVLDALRLYAAERGCDIRTEIGVTDLVRKNGRFGVVTADGIEYFDAAVVACGGLAAPKLGACGDGYQLLKKFGHSVTPRYPAIAALKTPPEPVRGLKGIRMHGIVELFADGVSLRRETGEILFSENGISGIAAMQLARDVNLALARSKKCTVKLCFCPDLKPGYMKTRAQRLSKRSLEDFLSGIVPKRLGQTIINAAGIRPLSLVAGSLTTAQTEQLERVMGGWEIPVTGTQSFDNAQVTCGGVPLSEFEPKTLCSLKADSLYAIGEVLDADGDCGGFNLHWAWASANAVARALTGK